MIVCLNQCIVAVCWLQWCFVCIGWGPAVLGDCLKGWIQRDLAKMLFEDRGWCWSFVLVNLSNVEKIVWWCWSAFLIEGDRIAQYICWYFWFFEGRRWYQSMQRISSFIFLLGYYKILLVLFPLEEVTDQTPFLWTAECSKGRVKDVTLIIGGCLNWIEFNWSVESLVDSELLLTRKR